MKPIRQTESPPPPSRSDSSSLSDLIRESGRYLLSSLLLLILNLALTALAHEVWKWSEQAAFLFAQIATLFVAYLSMKYFVRGTGDNPVRRELPAFVATSIGLRCLEYLAFIVLIKLLPAHYLIVATLVKTGFFAGKFFFYRAFVFSTKAPPSAQTSGGRVHRDRDLFDSIAHNITRKDLEKPSSAARRQRIRQTIAALPLTRAESLLEVGCGAGFGARYIDHFYNIYEGIDYSSTHIDQARTLNASPKRSFTCNSLEAFEPSHPLQVICMIGVLHHMEDLQSQLRRCFALLQPGGFLVLNEPHNRNPLWMLLRRMRQKVDTAYSTEQEFVEQSQLSQLIHQAGFREISFRGQGFFSTPFAEVTLPVPPLARILSALACRIDLALESGFPGIINRLSWNLIAVAQKPAEIETRSP